MFIVNLSAVAQPQAAPVTSGPNTSYTADFYVSPTGNDAWPGTLAQPFKTVDRARRAVQSRKTAVTGRTITVLLRGGTYYLPFTWNFTAADSGTSTTPVLYANYPGETPVISGGTLIKNWTQNANGSWKTTLPAGS